jgi:hypothetical protein
MALSTMYKINEQLTAAPAALRPTAKAGHFVFW